MVASALVIVSLLCLCWVSPVNAKVVGAFVLPHGGIALDPEHFDSNCSAAKAKAREIHKAAITLGQNIASLDPSVIILITPHGIADNNNIMLYTNPSAYGQADTDNCKCPPCCYNATISINTAAAQLLTSHMQLHSQNVSSLSAYGPSGTAQEPFPLRWGEIIPWILMGKPSTPAMIMSMPSRRYHDPTSMVPELLRVGQLLRGFLDQQAGTSVVIASADLAHTHASSGPYGYSSHAKPFDAAVVKWAETGDSRYLLQDASHHVDQAKSCGYTGLVILEGMLGSCKSGWVPSVLAHGHPDYYGMMVAQFVQQDQQKLADSTVCLAAQH
eukprot:jgi/Chrzof1/3158/Cz12g14010.t1